MSATVTKEGPYYSSGAISFSSLRSNFKKSTSGNIKASELRRNTDVNNTDPIVPDCTENRTTVSASPEQGISTLNDLKISQFRNSIKYYYITQTGTDVNFNIGSQSWNNNLIRNIRKWMYLNGTMGSNSTGSSAAAFGTSNTINLTISVSGSIYGAGGSGGTSGTISGGSGGPGLSVSSSGGLNIKVQVNSGAKIYGGGGGGEKGLDGGPGSGGVCTGSTTVSGCGGAPGCPGGWYQTGEWSGGCCQTYCQWCGWSSCGCQPCSQWQRYRSCAYSNPTSAGTGGTGGDGGPGRGYNNFSGSLSGSPGIDDGSSGGGCGSTRGPAGSPGGPGGDWGDSGTNTPSSGNGGPSGAAIIGSNYTVTGTLNANTIQGSY
jgi:hypothetical protein